MLERMNKVVEPYLMGALELSLGNTAKATPLLEASQGIKEVSEEEERLEDDEAKGKQGEALNDNVQENGDEPAEGQCETLDNVVAEEESEAVEPKLASKEVPHKMPPVTDDEGLGDQEADDVPQGEGWDEDM
jgi:hypothetical protein